MFASRTDKDGQSALSGNRLSIYRPGLERERRYAEDVEALKAILTEVFRITLPPAEALDPALERVFAAVRAKAEG